MSQRSRRTHFIQKDNWNFLTITTTHDIQDVVTITIGPKHTPHRRHRWISGVSLLLDENDQPYGATIALSLLRSRTITLPLKGRKVRATNSLPAP